MRPDPRDLEGALAGRACPEPPADLRGRLLAAVSAERAAAPPRPRWRWAWQAVAAVLALNLAMSAVNGIRYQALLTGTAPSREVAPVPRGETDDYIPSFAVSALGQLAAAPDAGHVVRRFIEQ